MVLRLAQGAGRRSWGPSVFVAIVVGVFLLLTARSAGIVVWVVGLGFVDMSPGLGVNTGTLSAAAVVAGILVGRRWPWLGTLLCLLPFVTTISTGVFVWGWWLGLLAVTFLTSLDGVRRAVVPFVATILVAVWYCQTDVVAFLPIGPVTAGSPGSRSAVLTAYVVVTTIVVTCGWLFGQARRTWARGIEVEAAEQHAFEVESLAGERARLARDLHDVVAHHVSLVAVRAESAPYVHPSLNDEARGVLAAIAADAREALTELRQVLVVLQRTDGSDRAPQPTACDVDGLVDSAVAAGQPVVVVGTWTDISPAIGYVLYRAVQEGLTNARRHAQGGTTRLLRTQSGDRVGFSLSNAAQSVDEPGRGLIGMRERVESLGGSLDADVVDGQFVLAVSLPTAGSSSTQVSA